MTRTGGDGPPPLRVSKPAMSGTNPHSRAVAAGYVPPTGNVSGGKRDGLGGGQARAGLAARAGNPPVGWITRIGGC